jgi:hypothetical protein
MTAHDIRQASTAQLERRREYLFARTTGLSSVDEGYEILDQEIDLINEELLDREHELADPSAGIPGLHLPS